MYILLFNQILCIDKTIKPYMCIYVVSLKYRPKVKEKAVVPRNARNICETGICTPKSCNVEETGNILLGKNLFPCFDNFLFTYILVMP